MTTRISSVFVAAFAVFFVTAAMAQEVPQPKPEPECVKIADFFRGGDYLALNHHSYPDLMFGYSVDHKVIVVFLMQEKCIMAYEIVTPKNPEFDVIFKHVFADWLAGWNI